MKLDSESELGQDLADHADAVRVLFLETAHRPGWSRLTQQVRREEEGLVLFVELGLDLGLRPELHEVRLDVLGSPARPTSRFASAACGWPQPFARPRPVSFFARANRPPELSSGSLAWRAKVRMLSRGVDPDPSAEKSSASKALASSPNFCRQIVVRALLQVVHNLPGLRSEAYIVVKSSVCKFLICCSYYDKRLTMRAASAVAYNDSVFTRKCYN